MELLKNHITSQTDADILSLSIYVEDLHAKWLAELVDRFYPFDRETSFELEEIYYTTLQNKQNMIRLYHRLFGANVKPVSKTVYAFDFENRFSDEDHFFILDDAMAFKVLLKIRLSEFDNLLFYRQAATLVHDTVLQRFFDGCLPFKENKYQTLSKLLIASRKRLDNPQTQKAPAKETRPKENRLFLVKPTFQQTFGW